MSRNIFQKRQSCLLEHDDVKDIRDTTTYGRDSVSSFSQLTTRKRTSQKHRRVQSPYLDSLLLYSLCA